MSQLLLTRREQRHTPSARMPYHGCSDDRVLCDVPLPSSSSSSSPWDGGGMTGCATATATPTHQGGKGGRGEVMAASSDCRGDGRRGDGRCSCNARAFGAHARASWLLGLALFLCILAGVTGQGVTEGKTLDDDAGAYPFPNSAAYYVVQVSNGVSRRSGPRKRMRFLVLTRASPSLPLPFFGASLTPFRSTRMRRSSLPSPTFRTNSTRASRPRSSRHLRFISNGATRSSSSAATTGLRSTRRG